MLRTFLTWFVITVLLALYMVGFIWLMDRAIIDPIEVNAATPVYSVLNIIEWIAYICFGAGVWMSAWTR